ncbi:MAG: aminotransferase class IV [Flavobacterium sp.]|jgi:branched-chain amino acid aminotransferase|uniref:aminotransferase class IV n=1 Tax=Flavobacterium sp. TaxID=239 RepID=UPI001B67AA65|nr:aminotransferase class IV [Flavobacterium sp.]MBP6073883.1 aminotransferase class IV [Flavobacterium sp.]
MVNYNGTIQENSAVFVESNRGFLVGDAVFETIKVVNKQVLFLEDHYFRLMATMRICRMEIPMLFTMEYVEAQILQLIEVLPASAAFRVRFSVFRTGGGFYAPLSNEVAFVVNAMPLEKAKYTIEKPIYEVELYKDFHVSTQLLSTLKTNNKLLQVVGSVFAKENGYDNCLVLNEEKNIVEALQNNIFMKMGNVISTPPVSQGCVNGVMRKQVLAILSKMEGYQVIETNISPFDLQKADELFLTNVISGIQPITQYRKKTYAIDFSTAVVAQLNVSLQLN